MSQYLTLKLVRNVKFMMHQSELWIDDVPPQNAITAVLGTGSCSSSSRFGSISVSKVVMPVRSLSSEPVLSACHDGSCRTCPIRANRRSSVGLESMRIG